MKKYIYCLTLADAYRAINRENAIQAAKGEFYNITLKSAKNGKFAVIIG